MQVPHQDVSRFGIIDGAPMGDGVWKVSRLVEKPAVDEAPTDLAIFGRYILSAAVMRNLKQAKPGAEGEIQLTDSIDAVLADEEVYALVVDPSEGFDTGTPLAWLTTNIALALADPTVGSKVRAFIDRQLAE